MTTSTDVRHGRVVAAPSILGPLPATPASYPFSTMQRATRPLDLGQFDYVEEEYLLSGWARTWGVRDERAEPTGEPVEFTTRVLVRRPRTNPEPVAWLSVLNASQGYDIEDDWRRAWDYLIAHRHTYVGISCKPINADALRNFDPARYAALTWGGTLPGLVARPGWDAFQVLPGSEEGLAWDLIAQAATWLRIGASFPAPRRLFLMGQSQSGIYVNTYLSFFHDVFRTDTGGPLFDGYLPGAASVLVRQLAQADAGCGSAVPVRTVGPTGAEVQLGSYIPAPRDLDVPVITVSTEGDTALFGGDDSHFALGDGPMRRHWQVAGVPHSDARSPVIPANSEIERARRLPRRMDDALLARLSVLPVEPVVTAAMTAVLDWSESGRPAAPSVFFTRRNGHLVRDEQGRCLGGLRLGMVAEPLASWIAADRRQPVIGAMRLRTRAEVLARFPTPASYRAACDRVDDELAEAGYLEPHGRELLRRVGREVWHRAVDGAPPLATTPQQPNPAMARRAAGR